MMAIFKASIQNTYGCSVKKVDISAHSISLTNRLHEHIQRRLGFVYLLAEDQVRQVFVSLSKRKDDQGRLGMYCRIEVLLCRRSDMVIEDVEADIYTAVDRAIDRLDRRLRRCLMTNRTA